MALNRSNKTFFLKVRHKQISVFALHILWYDSKETTKRADLIDVGYSAAKVLEPFFFFV